MGKRRAQSAVFFLFHGTHLPKKDGDILTVKIK
jgi:hypothetical protein